MLRNRTATEPWEGPSPRMPNGDHDGDHVRSAACISLQPFTTRPLDSARSFSGLHPAARVAVCGASRVVSVGSTVKARCCVTIWPAYGICVTVCAKRSDGPERRPLEGARSGTSGHVPPPTVH